MSESGPTILVMPQTMDESASAISLDVALMIVVAGGLVCIAIWMYTRRYHRLDARERAFRKLSKASGLSRSQIHMIRKYADSMGTLSPVGVLLCPRHMDAAFALLAPTTQSTPSAARASETSVKALTHKETGTLSVVG